MPCKSGEVGSSNSLQEICLFGTDIFGIEKLPCKRIGHLGQNFAQHIFFGTTLKIYPKNYDGTYKFLGRMLGDLGLNF